MISGRGFCRQRGCLPTRSLPVDPVFLSSSRSLPRPRSFFSRCGGAFRSLINDGDRAHRFLDAKLYNGCPKIIYYIYSHIPTLMSRQLFITKLFSSFSLLSLKLKFLQNLFRNEIIQSFFARYNIL